MEGAQTLSVWVTSILNILIWPLVHVSVSWYALRRANEKFDGKSWLYLERDFEKKGRFYEELFFIKKWKDRLPNGAAFFGVKIDRSRAALSSKKGREKLYLETMRSEWAHWTTILVGLALSSFNTIGVWLVMLCYALVANLPCLLAQRYNRIKLKRLI